MQQDTAAKNSSVRKIERIRNHRTPDRLETARNMDVTIANRSTMSAFNSPNRKMHTSRISMSTTSLNSVSLRKMELENYNLEMELMYSEYVSSVAEDILEKKINKDTEASYINTIKQLHEESKSLREKLRIIQTRMNDVKMLSCANDFAESIIQKSKDFQATVKRHDVKAILVHLEQLLDRFNVLRCENVVLPESAIEVAEFQNTLKKCCNILQEISDPDSCQILDKIVQNYESFVKKYQDIKNVMKVVDEKVCNIQIDTLKTCSHMLSKTNI